MRPPHGPQRGADGRHPSGAIHLLDFPKPNILVEPETETALKKRDLTLYCHIASTLPAAMSFV